MSSSTRHDNLGKEFALLIVDYARIFPYFTGHVLSLAGKRMSIGISGVSDWVGFLNNGKFLAVETKTGKGKLSEGQINFRRVVQSFGGVFIELRDLQQGLQEVKNALGG